MLRQIRNERKLTQEQLAKLSGVPQATISRIESGKIADPAWKIVSKISQALRVQPDKLFPVE